MSTHMCAVEPEGSKTSQVSGAVRTSGAVRARFMARGGKTQLCESYFQAPLKIAKPFEQSDGSLELCVMDCSPGLLANDCYDFHWQLEDGAHAKITTQSFAKVHPSRENPAQQNLEIQIGRDAFFEYSPQPIILFRDAHLRSECSVHIARGGLFLMSDILCAGRVGRNEIFEFHRYQSKIQIHFEGQLAFCNQTLFDPETHVPQRLGNWGTSTHYGNFYCFSELAATELLEEFRELLKNYPQLIAGASLVHKNGIVVSALGSNAWMLQEAFQHLSACARSHFSVKV